MATPFSRTLRSFGADDFRFGTASVVVAILIIAGWVAWACSARVPVYVVSDRARIEASRELYFVASPISGHVVAVHIHIGKELKEGDVLFELSAEDSQLGFAEEQIRQAASVSQVSALLSELKNEEEALVNERESGKVALDEERARHRDLEEVARFAEDELEKMLPLYKSGVLAEIVYLRLQSEAKRRQAAVEASRLSLDRLVWDQRTKENNRKARLANLKTEIVRLRGNLATSRAAGERLTHDVSRHQVRCPISGRVGELSNLRVGSVVHEGDRLGAVIPDGQLKAVGLFSPEVALGRIRAGQAAHLRLDGFPWTQYGTVPMMVSNISNETRDGSIRIEFILKTNTNAIPMQHGLTGSVEVEVDQISPAALVLRTIGKRLSSHTPA